MLDDIGHTRVREKTTADRDALTVIKKGSSRNQTTGKKILQLVTIIALFIGSMEMKNWVRIDKPYLVNHAATNQYLRIGRGLCT